MSQENVEIVRRMLEAGVQDRVKGVLGYRNVEIEWTTTDAYVE